jgi:hypothetical protein
MQHILRELLLEHKLSGPIRSALENGGYYEPHQVILLDPIGLHTNRSASGEYIDDSVPLSQQFVRALLKIQAYHSEKLVDEYANDSELFLPYDKWMEVTHSDLMRYAIKQKQDKDRMTGWGAENRVPRIHA